MQLSDKGWFQAPPKMLGSRIAETTVGGLRSIQSATIAHYPDLPLYHESQGWIAIERKSFLTLHDCMVTSQGAESDRQMLWSSTVMWISVVYLAGVAIFLTIAERAPVDPGQRYSNDDGCP